MPISSRKSLPLLLAVALVAVGIVYLLVRRQGEGPGPDRTLSHLGKRPDWSELQRYSKVLTRRTFEDLLREVYTLDEAWRNYFTIEEDALTVMTGSEEPIRIEFGSETPPPRYWRPLAELPPAEAGRPLQGLRIAIDPGHLGGPWAELEERWYTHGDNTTPVAEGDMTLATAKLLKPRLEDLGAEVHLVRSDTEPLTDKRAKDFEDYAQAMMRGAPKKVRHGLAERLFYRTAEIRARAKLVNEEIKPDLILCLHFNAEDWGDDPKNPALTTLNHYHIILHGAYLPGELAHEDERFEMLHKIFQGSHQEEAAIAKELSRAIHTESGLPAYLYRLDAPALNMGPGLWARNLLANRLYQCPVLFLEPYVMNSEDVFARVQAGDYEGTRRVAGKLRKSLFREYASAVVKGLVNYYGPRRKGVREQ